MCAATSASLASEPRCASTSRRACAAARADLPNDALDALSDAISLNPALRVNARKDSDLGDLREAGLMDVLLSTE